MRGTKIFNRVALLYVLYTVALKLKMFDTGMFDMSKCHVSLSKTKLQFEMLTKSGKMNEKRLHGVIFFPVLSSTLGLNFNPVR